MGVMVAVANQKGGVGKTTLTVHLAKGCVDAGKRVIVVDADPQGNLSSWLVDEAVDDLYRLLMLDEPALKAVRVVKAFGCALVGGGWKTGKALTMMSSVGELDLIPKKLRALSEVADVVLVDMPPSRLPGFEQMLAAADWAIVPTKLERMSVEGVVLMSQTIQQMERGPRLMGIVPNMTRARTKEHQAQMQDLVTAFGGVVWPPLPLTIRMTEASSFGVTVFDLCPNEDVALAMRQVVGRMMGVLDGRA